MCYSAPRINIWSFSGNPGGNKALRLESGEGINLTNMTFDIGVRLDIFGFLIEGTYAFPVTVPLGGEQDGPAKLWQKIISGQCRISL